MSSTKVVQIIPLWSKFYPAPRGHTFTLNYIRKTSNDFISSTANSTGMIPGWSPTKIV